MVALPSRLSRSPRGHGWGGGEQNLRGRKPAPSKAIRILRSRPMDGHG